MTWHTVKQRAPVARTGHIAAVAGGRVLLFGGEGPAGLSNEVLELVIEGDAPLEEL